MQATYLGRSGGDRLAISDGEIKRAKEGSRRLVEEERRRREKEETKVYRRPPNFVKAGTSRYQLGAGLRSSICTFQYCSTAPLLACRFDYYHRYDKVS